jgi:hypothetical protein
VRCCDHPQPVPAARKVKEAIARRLEQTSAAAVETKKLFGTSLAAEGPKPFALAACQNHWNHVACSSTFTPLRLPNPALSYKTFLLPRVPKTADFTGFLDFYLFIYRTYAVGQFLAGCAREKLSKIQSADRKCVSPESKKPGDC